MAMKDNSVIFRDGDILCNTQSSLNAFWGLSALVKAYACLFGYVLASSDCGNILHRGFTIVPK